MSPDPAVSHRVQRTDQLSEVERVNEFFNSQEIKEDLHWFTYQDTLKRAFRRDDRRLYYIEADTDGDIIGALMVWCESRVLGDNEAQIRLVAVNPDYRNQGLGSYLCKRAEEFAQSQDQSLMIADVAAESPAVSFWGALGYSETDYWKTNNDREMIRVTKSI
jgi:ribosomal protein S18 acetylase RimI-like enzyme